MNSAGLKLGRDGCPGCGGVVVQDLGSIPATNRFAGRLLPRVLAGGNLWSCEKCHLVFRSPVLSKSELAALYEDGSVDAWSGNERQRLDWRIAKHWLDEILPVNARLLDVGCFDGGFLDLMGKRYRRYGIELNSMAVEKARSRDIEVVGSDIDILNSELPVFSCITAIDVIEHVVNPAIFLQNITRHISPGGWILIATGNSAAWSFRFMGATYWYCTVAEHLSFISPRWLGRFARLNGLQVVRQVLYSHGQSSKRVCSHLLDLTKNVLYRASPRTFAWLRRRGLGGDFARADPQLEIHPPSWLTAKDHFITLLKKMP